MLFRSGTEWNYINNDGKWNVWAAYHHSFKQTITDKNQYIDAGFMHSNRRWSFVLDAGSVGTNYYTDMGFVARINNYDAIRDTTIRVGFKQLYSDFTYRIFPEKGKVVQHVIKATNIMVVNPDYTHNESTFELQYNINYKNTSGFEFTGTHNRVNILYPTAFTAGTPLPIGNYDFQQMAVGYQSDFRKKVNVLVKLAGGEFYNGHYQSFRTVLSIRHQPHINIALQAEYNKIQLPGEYGSTE